MPADPQTIQGYNVVTLLKRLEAATSRLEDLTSAQKAHVDERGPQNAAATKAGVDAPSRSSAAPAAPAAATSSAAADADLPKWISEFDALIKTHVDPFVATSKQLDATIGEQAEAFKKAFDAQRDFLAVAAVAKKPEPTSSAFAELVKPISSNVESIMNIREKTRDPKVSSHLATVAEGAPLVGWVASDLPLPLIGDFKDSAQFYSNRVLKDFKSVDPKHVEWVKGFNGIADALQAYVKEFHTTGPTWKVGGIPVEEALKTQSKSATMPAIFPDNGSMVSDDMSSYSRDVLSLMVPRTRRPPAVTLPYIPSPNPFHTLDLYLPESGLCPTTKWLIFIHGGYWRDASQSKDVGASILTRLPPHWAGASIDYRLSPEVEHPDHLHDVTAAVQFLRNAYGIKTAVILAHGAGACMAFQYVAARLSLGETWVKHIVGSGGVYDLLDVSQSSPCYKSYILDAYGADAENWDDSSPARLEWDALYGPDVADLKFTLVHSKHDTLVPLRQVLQFEDTLTKAGFTATLRLVDIHDHDAVLETSDLINVVLAICEEMDHKEEQQYLRLLE